MRVVLVGNPNVGKSSLFSRLTGTRVLCSNYPGTTVDYCSGKFRLHGAEAELVDAPGTYSLESKSPAEVVASRMVDSADAVVNVVDASNLERNLYLTMQLLESGKPLVVALNMSDEAGKLGVKIDARKLGKILGVPVVETVAISGEGVLELVERMPDEGNVPKLLTEDDKWARIGYIVANVQTHRESRRGLVEAVEDATVRPLTGLVIAAVVLYAVFSIIIYCGNFITEKVFDPLFNTYWMPFAKERLRPILPPGVLANLLFGRNADLVDGLGILTTGVYVPVAMILPFVILFYLMLAVLEDSGYLPRLATLSDNLMHKLGLHGLAIVPTVLGLGCRVPGILATRMLETRKQRFIAASLLALCVPCLAQNAVIIGLLARQGIYYVALVYGILALLYVVAGVILNRVVGGESPEILMEIPPYRMPDLRSVLTKTWVRVRYFITEAVPYIILGVASVNLLYALGIMDTFTAEFGPPMSALFGLPQEAVVALLLGFLRKDFAAGMLAPIKMTAMQLTVASVLLVVYAPCLATLTVLYNELGFWDFIRFLAIMALATVVTGVTLNALFL